MTKTRDDLLKEMMMERWQTGYEQGYGDCLLNLTGALRVVQQMPNQPILSIQEIIEFLESHRPPK